MATENKARDKSRNLRNEFNELPIEDKITTLIDFEIMTLAAGLEKLGECSVSWAKKILETAFPDSRQESEKRESSQM